MNYLTAIEFIIIVANTVIAEDHHKRAPSGFTGVRGKKFVPDSAYDSINEDSKGPDILLKPEDCSVAISDRHNGILVPSGFIRMRGMKRLTYVHPWVGTYPDTPYKRAPSGFMGMRGKKDNEFVGYDIKRIPSGFMKMRGKKDISNPYLRTSHYYSDKRTPMGFLGVRGKKVYNGSLHSNNKRAPSGFFGMRGKKHPSGFFGVRGKKYPYEFRGKFVGVRGKKMSNDITSPEHYADLDLQQLGEKLKINQLMLLLTEQNEADNKSWNKNSSDLNRQ